MLQTDSIAHVTCGLSELEKVNAVIGAVLPSEHGYPRVITAVRSHGLKDNPF